MALLNTKKRRIRELEEELTKYESSSFDRRVSVVESDPESTPIVKSKAKAKSKGKAKAKAKARSSARKKDGAECNIREGISSSIAVRPSDEDLFSGWAAISDGSDTG